MFGLPGAVFCGFSDKPRKTGEGLSRRGAFGKENSKEMSFRGASHLAKERVSGQPVSYVVAIDLC